MDSDKFGEAIIPKVIEKYRKFGKNVCEFYIQELINDKALALTEKQCWRLKSLLWSREKNYQKEIECFDRIIELEDHQVVSSIFLRGYAKFRMKDYDEAINDFTEALSLGERIQDYSYQDTLYFFLAVINFRLGKLEDSQANLEYVHNDFSFWTDRLESKAELLKEIKKYVS